MLQRIALFLRYLKRFGVANGFSVYFKIKNNRTQKIKLSTVKYPFTLRKKTSDIPTFVQVFISEQYRMNLPIVPKTIVDGGANVGLASIYFKSQYTESEIVAVEPDPENFEVLKQNLEPYNGITLLKAGLWNRPASLDISDKYNMGKWAMVVEESADNNPNGLKTITIPELMKNAGWETIDLLKLDIEGAERILFKDNYAEWLPKCKIIVIELHDWMVKGCTKIFFEALNKTVENYTMTMLGENIIIVNDDLLNNNS